MNTCSGLEGYCRRMAESASAERDSLGNPLSAAQSEYSRNSKDSDGAVDVYTWQRPEVADILRSGKVYTASYGNIFAPEYEEQYRRLSELLGLGGCPIFGVFIDSLDGLDDSNDARAAAASMDVHDGTKVPIHLRVPRGRVFDTDYYGWSDYLFYSSDVGRGDRNPFGYSESESLRHLDRFMGFSRGGKSGRFFASQAVMGEIRPEWVVR